MSSKKVYIMIVGIVVIALTAVCVFFASKNHAEHKRVNDVLSADLNKAGGDIGKLAQDKKGTTSITALNCVLTSGGPSDLGGSKAVGGSSMKNGVLAVQFRKAKGQKSDVEQVKVSPGTCIVLYPFDKDGNLDAEKGDSLKHGYALVGVRADSKMDSLPVYSSVEHKIVDKHYNAQTGKFE